MKQKEKIALLKKARTQLEALDYKRDKIYSKLCKKLDLRDPQGPDVLFDFIYNGFNQYHTLKNLLDHLE